MTCDIFQSQLTALLDGELPPEGAAALEAHLMDCSACSQARIDLRAVADMTAAWAVDALDITDRVMNAVASEEQNSLREEMRRLRSEMQELRAELTALRRQLSRRDDPLLWRPAAKPQRNSMENDPWNFVRS